MSNLIGVEKRVGKFLGARWKASTMWIVDCVEFRIREIQVVSMLKIVAKSDESELYLSIIVMEC